MFLFHPVHFLKFLVKSQPQRSYKKGSYIKKKKRVYLSGNKYVTSGRNCASRWTAEIRPFLRTGTQSNYAGMCSDIVAFKLFSGCWAHH